MTRAKAAVFITRNSGEYIGWYYEVCRFREDFLCARETRLSGHPQLAWFRLCQAGDHPG